MDTNELIEERMPRAMIDGRQVGRATLTLVKNSAEIAGSMEDKLLWWHGFLGVMSGFCAGSVGGPSAVAILEKTADIVGEAIPDEGR